MTITLRSFSPAVPLKSRRVVSLGIYGIAAALPKGVNALLAIAYSAVLPAGDLGIYGVCLALSSALGILTDAGLMQAVLRGYYDRHANVEEARAYLARMILGARLVSLAILAVMLLAGLYAWGPLTSGKIPLWPYLPLVLAAGFADRSFGLLGAVARALERPLAFTAGGLARAVGQLGAAAVLVLWLGTGVPGAVAALLAGGLAGTLIQSIVLARAIGGSVRLRGAFPRDLREALGYGLPLLPTQLANWGRQLAQRVILLHLVATAEVGIFFLGNSLAQVLAIVTQTVQFAFTPVYFKRRVTGAQDFQPKVLALQRVLLALLAPAFAALILFVGDIIELLFAPEYAQARPIAAVMLAATFLQVQQPFMQKQLLFHKATRIIPLITGVPIVLSLLGTVVLVPLLGLIAAAWLACAANAAILVGAALAIRRIEPPDHPLIAATVLGTAVIAAAAFMAHGPGAAVPFAIRLGIVAVFTIACLLIWVWPNRRLIRQMLMR